MRKILLIIFVLSFSTASIFGQVNTLLDLTFNTTGVNSTAIGSTNDVGRAIVIQPNDSKILVAGRSYNGVNLDYAVVRYNTDGSLDNNFGTSGKVTTAIGTLNDYGSAIALQSNGKIVVAGSSNNGNNYDFSLVRYNSDGSLDATFGTNGKVIKDIANSTEYGTGVLIKANGKIVVTGYTNNGTYDLYAAVQFNSDGTIDNSFGTNGVATVQITSFSCQANAAILQPDGKIVLGGYAYVSITKRFAVCRINDDGTIDNTFGVNGSQTTYFNNSDGSIITSLALQPNGEIVAAGYCGVPGSNSTKIALARYNSDGTHDNGFHLAITQYWQFGGTSSDAAYGVALKQNGDIVLACTTNEDYQSIGSRNYLLLAYFDSVGYIRGTSCAVTVITGTVNGAEYASCIAVQPDNKTVIAGTTQFYYSPTQTTTNKFGIARYTAGITGVEEFTKDDNSLLLYPNPANNQLFIETNGTPVTEINIYNTTGALVSQTKQPQSISIDISNIVTGVYIAEIKTKDASVKRRWVKM